MLHINQSRKLDKKEVIELSKRRIPSSENSNNLSRSRIFDTKDKNLVDHKYSENIVNEELKIEVFSNVKNNLLFIKKLAA